MKFCEVGTSFKYLFRYNDCIFFGLEIFEQNDEFSLFHLSLLHVFTHYIVHTLKLDHKTGFLVFFVHISESLEDLEMHFPIFLYLKIMHTKRD